MTESEALYQASLSFGYDVVPWPSDPLKEGMKEFGGYVMTDSSPDEDQYKRIAVLLDRIYNSVKREEFPAYGGPYSVAFLGMEQPSKIVDENNNTVIGMDCVTDLPENYRTVPDDDRDPVYFWAWYAVVHEANVGHADS